MSRLFVEMCQHFGLVPLADDELDQLPHERAALNWFRQISESYAAGRNPSCRIDIGYVKSPEVNAFAVTWKGLDFIAINTGTIEALGRMSVTAVHSKVFDASLLDARKAAWWVLQCCQFFIFSHEMGHIWNGHTSWLVEMGAMVIDERRQFDGKSVRPLDYQTLEMDADAFAVSNLRHLIKTNELPFVNDSWELEYGKGTTLLIMTSFSLYVVFLAIAGRAEFRDIEGSHPSPAKRQLINATALTTIILGEGVANEQTSAAVIFGMSQASEALGADEADLREQLTRHEEVWEYARALLRNWGTLRPHLDKVKRGGKLAEVQNVQ